MGELKYLASVINGDDEGEFLNLIQETLEIIGKKGENIDDIRDNVIFIFHTIPGITGGTQSHSVISSFNLSSLRKDIEDSGGDYQERAKDIIAHEIAHYVLNNYHKDPSEEIERQTDDYIEEKWDFNRAYTSRTYYIKKRLFDYNSMNIFIIIRKAVHIELSKLEK